ncbi:MAG TPA: sulfite exporter TauE/SafE family protein, partial [Candidatus Nitrosotalea sp.]|nr:sulfite exporter TauE/SafE family protein [Candidatus Nitrosotalea sp.]
MVSAHLIVPAAAALVAGAMNSVAGGGSFLSFPALLFAGVAPISANATNNAAMWVGTIGSARGYREELVEHRALLLPVISVSIVGSLIGACLLLLTPQALFARLIPWLLLFATGVFAASPLLRKSPAEAPRHAPWQIAAQFAVAIYGGYFGAGMGI